MNSIRVVKNSSILLIIFLLIACSNGDKGFTSEQATDDIVGLFSNGNYETAYEQWFSKELKESLSVEEIENEWETLVKERGNFVEISSLETGIRDNLEIAEAKVKYTDITFAIRLIFNDDKDLVGFKLSDALINADIPGSVIEEEIIIGKGTDFELGGTLTLPNENQRYLPAVVLVHGSGPTDRDESAFAYKPFRDIAWGLAEQGIAVIRYDKRTHVYGQKMVKNAANLTVYEETVEDAIRASELVKNDHRIDEENVYIIGHSLGGMLAPRIDIQGGEFAGLVILGGTTRSLWELVYDQNHYVLESGEIDKNESKEYLEFFEEEFKKGLKLQDISLDDAKDISIFGVHGYYLKEMEQYDTESLVQNLEKPILVLQGEDDFQVYYEKDFAIFEDLLGDKESARLISYKNLNHFFVEYQGPDKGTIEEYNHPGRVNEKVIEDIGKWILEN